MSTIEGVSDWRKPIMEYLFEGKLLEDDKQYRKIRIKAISFVIQDGVLYKKGYLAPSIRCVNVKEAEYLINEMLEGIVSAHGEQG